MLLVQQRRPAQDVTTEQQLNGQDLVQNYKNIDKHFDDIASHVLRHITQQILHSFS